MINNPSPLLQNPSKIVLVLPNDVIKQSCFKEGDELEVEVKKGEIKLKKE